MPLALSRRWQGDMSVLHFSSEAFPANERASAIQDIWAPVTRIDLAPADRRRFFVDASALVLPGLSIGWGRFPGYRAHRTRAHAADSADDLVFCLVADAGWSAYREGDEETECGPGEVYLSVNRDASVANAPGRCNTVINFAIPRDVLASAVLDLDAVSNAKLPASPALRLLTNYVVSLTQGAEAMSQAALERCANHVRDLAALALGANHDAAERARIGGLRASRLAGIKADIAAHLPRPDLSIGTVAARHGISPQYVRRLFNAEGTTFGDYVRELRLARVRRLIAQPALRDRSIATLAYEAGFGDLSHFNRAFRQRFGVTPSDVRAAALREGHSSSE